jgi:hypothetical protein
MTDAKPLKTSHPTIQQVKPHTIRPPGRRCGGFDNKE